jgi:exoribonuclease-2
MSLTTPQPNSLVLYKHRPALVKQVGAKLEIEVDDGKTVRVRPKDVSLLHPGPLKTLSDLKPQTGEVATAWELLAGTTTTLAEVAELMFEDYNPATAWAAWQVVIDGLYFHGTPEAVIAALPEEVAKIQAAREAREIKEQARVAFLARVRTGQILPEDEHFLREVEDLALERSSQSRILRELGHAESYENAHALLLELGYWDANVNPYPRRWQLATTVPTASLPELPDEARLDLTHLAAFAIDDEGSRDPDDALSLDGARLWVHVADAAAIVLPNSPADREARARGANLYLPEGTIPMLPPQATQRLGLGLAEISPALSFGLDLDEQHQVTRLEVVPSWVRVRRLSYEEAEDRLDEEPFRRLSEITSSLEARRRANGAAIIELPEVKVRLVEGEVVIHLLAPLKSRDMVREAMVMAGEALARFALEEDISLPFTSQAPAAEGDFSTTLSGMYARRRSFSRSQVKTVPGPHAGLGLEVYTQATSPLRRYVDLVAHQQLRTFFHGEETLSDAEVIERVGAAEAVTGSVRQAERLANKHWTLVYLQNHPDWQGEGILVERRHLRGTVLIPQLDLETRLHLRQELPLDTTISLKLDRVKLPELEAYFRPAD